MKPQPIRRKTQHTIGRPPVVELASLTGPGTASVKSEVSVGSGPNQVSGEWYR